MTKLEEYQKFIFGKKVLIWGLGLQGGGLSSALFFAKNGAHVKVTDLKTESELNNTLDKLQSYPISYRLGSHEQSDFHWADIVVVNQDVFHRAPHSPYLAYLKEHQEKFETEMGLFFKLCEKPVIGVTGSRGKTTTTTVLGDLLLKANKATFVGGNIPQSMNLYHIEEANQCDFVVLELSNYQLHGIEYVKKSPHIAIITSISPDHFVSYASFDDYVADKRIIYRYQNEQDHLLIKRNGEFSDQFAQETNSRVSYFDKQTLPGDYQLHLLGDHNRENMGAVYAVAKILEIDDQVIRNSICSFTGVAYRLQKIREIKGISFYNDTTATTPTAAGIALNSFPKNNIIWIGGGSTKKLPVDELVNIIDTQVKKIILLKGTGTEELIPVMEKKCQEFSQRYLGTYDNLKKATEIAYQSATIGDVVLLSPGFTSFGMFVNEFDRGEQFDQIVASL